MKNQVIINSNNLISKTMPAELQALAQRVLVGQTKYLKANGLARNGEVNLMLQDDENKKRNMKLDAIVKTMNAEQVEETLLLNVMINQLWH